MSDLLIQSAVDAGCKAAKARYDAMGKREAMIAFSYEYQGWVASMVGKGMCLAEANMKVIDLMTMMMNANGSK